MNKFKTIGISGRTESEHIVETLVILKQYLSQNSYNIILEQSISPLLGQHNLEVMDLDRLGEKCDLIIVVGGDGSILGAARGIIDTQTPVLGINKGCLGFLTDIVPEYLEKQLDLVFSGYYTVEERFLLNLKVIKNGHVYGSSMALNEVVIHPERFSKMIEFELFINDHFVLSQKSDGMIITTPTGSTAYALSAGGPIMHPNLNAISLIPMYPHTLSNRPLVVDYNSEIKIKIGKHSSVPAKISTDGQVYLDPPNEADICIRKKDQKLCFIHPKGYNYYEVCRTKLGWGRRLDKNNNQ